MENIYYTKDPITGEQIERKFFPFLDIKVMTPEELEQERIEAEERAANF